jgi:hypothetical protein
MTRKVIIPFILLIFFGLGLNQAKGEQLQIKKNLSAEWLIYEEGEYKKFEGQSVPTVYLRLNANTYAGDFLKIDGTAPFTLFVNGKLAATGSKFLLSIDSLSQMFSPSLVVGIHQQTGLHNLSTTIQTTAFKSDEASMRDQRKSTHFRDFTIIAALVLVVLLVVIVRLNPKLASDYFSVTRIFSFHEGEDAQLYTRITSSTNILFYLFCSLMLGYYMMIVFQFVADRYPIAAQFQNTSFFEALWLWVKFSLILLLFFFAKIIVVYGLSKLFGFQGMAGVHFFNWVRLIIVIFGIACVILSFYFIARGQSETFFNVLFKFLSWTMVGWMILILLKLRGKSEHSVFHLFSYICATELIPFLFIIKILYN